MSAYTVVLDFFKRRFTMCFFCGYPTSGNWTHKSCHAKELTYWDKRIEQLAAEEAAEAAFHDWLEEQEIRREADQRHLAKLMDSFCTEPGCYEEAAPMLDLCLKCAMACPDDGCSDWKCDQGYTDDETDDFDYEEEEDSLAGDVEPTGGYYAPPTHPHDAHRLRVMRQYGDYAE